MLEKYRYVVKTKDFGLEERMDAFTFLCRAGDEEFSLGDLYPNEHIISWIFQKIPEARLSNRSRGYTVHGPRDCEIYFDELFKMHFVDNGFMCAFLFDREVSDFNLILKNQYKEGKNKDESDRINKKTKKKINLQINSKICNYPETTFRWLISGDYFEDSTKNFKSLISLEKEFKNFSYMQKLLKETEIKQ